MDLRSRGGQHHALKLRVQPRLVESLDLVAALRMQEAELRQECLRRVENMVGMAGLEFPLAVLRDQMASTLDLGLHVARLTGGRRQVVGISEVVGLDHDTTQCQDTSRFSQAGVDPQGPAMGHFEASGECPQVLERMRAEGLGLPAARWSRTER